MLVREDLSPAQQLVQAVHAAHEAGLRFGDRHQISSAVICSVPDEKSLLRSKEEVTLQGIGGCLFHEPDLDGQATAFSTEPILGSQRRAMRKYPLWKPERLQV